MVAMVYFVAMTGGVAIISTALGFVLNETMFIQVGYVCGSISGLLLAVTPLFVWNAVNELRKEIKQQRSGSSVKPVSRL
jgi:hypothetical protein